jgi:hypothetical protein
MLFLAPDSRRVRRNHFASPERVIVSFAGVGHSIESEAPRALRSSFKIPTDPECAPSIYSTRFTAKVL